MPNFCKEKTMNTWPPSRINQTVFEEKNYGASYRDMNSFNISWFPMSERQGASSNHGKPTWVNSEDIPHLNASKNSNARMIRCWDSKTCWVGGENVMEAIPFISSLTLPSIYGLLESNGNKHIRVQVKVLVHKLYRILICQGSFNCHIKWGKERKNEPCEVQMLLHWISKSTGFDGKARKKRDIFPFHILITFFNIHFICEFEKGG